MVQVVANIGPLSVDVGTGQGGPDRQVFVEGLQGGGGQHPFAGTLPLPM